MSMLLTVLCSVSFGGLLILAVYRFITSAERRIPPVLIQLAVLAASFGVLYKLFWAHKPIIARSPGNEVYFVIILYGCMLLGMLAHYLYTRFGQPKAERRKAKFDVGMFIAPVFASPIVFIPLLAALQNTVENLQVLTATKMMVFFVAFENGFFWKEYFDHRLKAKQEEDAAKQETSLGR
jgi:hypothetical protein